MSRIVIDKLPPYYQEQVERKLQASIQSTPMPTAPVTAQPMDEATLQDLCERVLDLAGYRRLTEKNMVAFAMTNMKGWFAHIHHAVGNPLFSDLLVFNGDMTRCLHVELKVKPKFSRAQKSFITARLWKLAFTAQEFSQHLNEWEESHGSRMH